VTDQSGKHFDSTVSEISICTGSPLTAAFF
jgi:hypothetical protein